MARSASWLSLYQSFFLNCNLARRQREEQLKLLLKEEASSLGGGHDSAALAQTVCYTCALGDFGHSYILSQHEESRSGVAHQGAEFVAPGILPLFPLLTFSFFLFLALARPPAPSLP